MSVTLYMTVQVDEHTVKPLVHLGPLQAHPMHSGYTQERNSDNTILVNRHALGVFKEVLDFAEKIQDE